MLVVSIENPRMLNETRKLTQKEVVDSVNPLVIVRQWAASVTENRQPDPEYSKKECNVKTIFVYGTGRIHAMGVSF
jgi:hypothetical protein